MSNLTLLRSGGATQAAGGVLFGTAASYAPYGSSSYPVDGLVVNMQPESILTDSSGNFTGWRNLVNNYVVPAAAIAPLVNPTSSIFNGWPTISIGSTANPAAHQLAGIPVLNGTSAGMTIVLVVQSTTTSNADGSMVWYAQDRDNSRPLDLWTATSNHTHLVLNSFSGNQIGHNFSAPQLQPRLLIASIPQLVAGATPIGQIELEQNGQLLDINVSAGAVPAFSTTAFDLFPGGLPAGSGAYGHCGELACVMAYSRQLSAADRAQLRGYLAPKLGITL